MKITPSGKKKRFKNTAYLPEPNVLLDLAPFRPFSLVVAEASLGQVPQPALDKKFEYSIVKKRPSPAAGRKSPFFSSYLPEPNVLLDLAPFRPFSLVVAEASLGQVPQPALDRNTVFGLMNYILTLISKTVNR